MKRFVLPVLILAAFWYWVLRSKDVPVEVVEPEPAPPVKTAHVDAPPAPVPAKPAPRVEQVIAAPPPSANPDGRPEPPPKGTIPFKLYGDLVVSYGDVLIGHPTSSQFPERGFIPMPKFQEWKGKEIPYSVHQDLPDPERVVKVIEYFNANTPIKFVPLKEQADSIVFAPTNIPLCLSYVGRIGGHQPIFLDDRCGEREITHEVMHALGFVHEHSRPDRDQFVRVNWQNIEQDKQSQYEIVPETLAEPMKGRPFDYNSVMIYNDTDFGRVRGDITLESLDRDRKIAPVENGLSPEDLERLRIKYGN